MTRRKPHATIVNHITRRLKSSAEGGLEAEEYAIKIGRTSKCFWEGYNLAYSGLTSIVEEELADHIDKAILDTIHERDAEIVELKKRLASAIDEGTENAEGD